MLNIKAHQPCALTVTEREATGIRARQRDPNRQASRHSNNNLCIKMDFLFLLISYFRVTLRLLNCLIWVVQYEKQLKMNKKIFGIFLFFVMFVILFWPNWFCNVRSESLTLKSLLWASFIIFETHNKTLKHLFKLNSKYPIYQQFQDWNFVKVPCVLGRLWALVTP